MVLQVKVDICRWRGGEARGGEGREGGGRGGSTGVGGSRDRRGQGGAGSPMVP